MNGMPTAPAGGTLPYGTSMSDPSAPWNATEVEVGDEDLLEFIDDVLLGDIIFENEDTKQWQAEGEDGDWRYFTSKKQAVAFMLKDRYAWLEDQVAEKKREDMIDAQYDVTGPEDRF